MRLIDADALIQNHFSDEHRIALSYADKLWMRTIISDEPTIDAVPVVHGEWDENEYAFCNVCMECRLVIDRTCIKLNSGKLNYCPHCGAKMDGGKNDDK